MSYLPYEGLKLNEAKTVKVDVVVVLASYLPYEGLKRNAQ